MVFVDDLLVFSPTAEQHLEDLSRVIDMLGTYARDINIKLHPDKTVVAASTVEFLGHMVSADGLRPMQAKIAAIQALQPPTNATELLALLGLMNYYRGFIPQYAQIADPLVKLTRKDVVWGADTWQPEHQQALDTLKAAFAQEGLVLRRMHPDRPLILHTDFSASGISGVLSQQDEDGSEYLVAAVSRSLNQHERNYISYKGELLAAVWAMKTLRPYLHGRHFTLVTDHAPLLWLMENQQLQGQYARWAIIMSEFDFDVTHRPGQLNKSADCLSRSPHPADTDGSGVRLDEDSDPKPPPPRLVPYPGQASTDPAVVMCIAARQQYDRLHVVLASTTGLLPTGEELLAGGNGVVSDASECPAPQAVYNCTDVGVMRTAHRLVREQRVALRAIQPAPPQPQHITCDKAACEEPRVKTVNTSLLSHHFLEHAQTEGLVVVECGSALATGLEACLRAGMRVRRYIVTDCPANQHGVLKRRLVWLRGGYPDLLMARAVANPCEQLPAAGPVSEAALRGAGAQHGEQWVVVAQLAEDSINSVRTLVGALQRLQPRLPPAFVLAYPGDHREVELGLGSPVVLDAAQCGHGQHSVVSVWTNLADVGHLRCVVRAHAAVHAAPAVAGLLPARVIPVATSPLPAPHLQCDVPGQPVHVLPGEPPLRDVQLLHKGDPRPTALQAAELERVVGILPGSSADPRTPAGVQCDAVCSGIPVHVAHHVLAWSEALQRAYVTPHQMAVLPPRVVPGQQHGGEALAVGAAGPAPPRGATVLALAANRSADSAMHAVHVAEVTEQQEQVAQGDVALRDIWVDEAALSYLQQQHTGGKVLTPEERARVLRRVAHYRWQGNKLYKRMADGTLREVPPPGQRRELIERTHDRLGHFGVRRTLGLLSLGFWWYGMHPDVSTVVDACKACDKANVTGQAEPATMQPLPIQGFGYRWNVDLTGPLPTTTRGNKYILICVEAFTKQIELYPLPSKSVDHTARAFLDVVARYSAPAECVTDQGTEWEKCFARLCEQLMVDHRYTSPNHPQANGSAERVVQTVKKALRKLVDSKGNSSLDWDDELPWIAMGYRCSAQRATGYSPYQLLYGVPPVVPPAIRERVMAPLDLESPTVLAEALRQRAELCRHMAPAAGGNLLISQHRDSQRYARIRQGGYKPKFVRYQPGDYVYTAERNRKSTLQMPTQDTVLRVVSLDKGGVATLRGRCGLERKEHIRNLRPCHLPNVDPIVDARIVRPPKSQACEVCGFAGNERQMVLCPMCGTGWHTRCLDPPLPEVPTGAWVCPDCAAQGVTVAQVEALPEPTPRVVQQAPKFPSATQKRRYEEYAQLDGRRVLRQGDEGQELAGLVKYRGWASGAEPFEVAFEDGSVELMRFRELNRILLPVESGQGGRTRRNKGVSAVNVMGTQGETWNLTHWKGMQSVWGKLVPGITIGNAQAVSMAKVFAEVECGKLSPLGARVPKSSLVRLGECVELPAFVFDPWADAGGVAKELRRQQLVVWSNAWDKSVQAESHEKAWQPGVYERVKGVCGFEAIVTSPHPKVLDLAVPLAAAFAAVAAVLVPNEWLIGAHPASIEYLKMLEEEGRLVLIKAGVHGVKARAATWVLVFESEEVKHRLMRVSTGAGMDWVEM